MTTTIKGFTRQAMGDHMGSRSFFGACCGCRRQFMSTHEIVFVPTDAVRTINRFVHGPACESCARRAKPAPEAARRFRVEAHGQGVLVMRGGVGGFGGNPYAREPYFTREDAWRLAQSLMTSAYYTIKVFEVGAGTGQPCFQAFLQADGSWCDWKTARTLRAA